jgi:RND family efflux transporter MFP subunit
VATAALEKAQVLAAYLQITSPYDGVITQRGFFRGDFIRSADQNSQIPLFTVDRTDVMRVVVQIPDRDVPYTRAGNPAVVEIDTVPGIQFPGVVSRTADAEDQETRLMRAEIDLPNDKQLLRQGMYGIATIQLGTLAEAVRIPSSALVGEVKEHNGQVYVVKDGAVHLAPVRVGADDGVEMEVLRGLSLNDLVVSHPSGALYDGAKVSVSGPAPAAPTRSAKTE